MPVLGFPKAPGMFVVLQSLSRIQHFVTSWTATQQAPLSFTISQSLLRLTSIELVMLSNHLILCHTLLLLPSIFPNIRVFPNGSTLHIRWPKYCRLIAASVFPMNIRDWFPLGWTNLISLLSKGLSRVFSSNHNLKASIRGMGPRQFH